MQPPTLAVIAVLALPVFISCGGAALAADAAAAAGVYELDKAAARASMLAAMPAELRQDQQAMDRLDLEVNAMSAVIELDGDGSLNIRGHGTHEKVTGSWRLDGRNLILITKRNDGREESQTGSYRDGAFALELNEGGHTVRVNFQRK